MGIRDFFSFGPKHKGQHAAEGQRGKHAGGSAAKPAKSAKQQKRIPKGKGKK